MPAFVYRYNTDFHSTDGVATMGEFIAGVNTAYGMSLDLGGFLAIYGSVFDGNLLGCKFVH